MAGMLSIVLRDQTRSRITVALRRMTLLARARATVHRTVPAELVVGGDRGLCRPGVVGALGLRSLGRLLGRLLRGTGSRGRRLRPRTVPLVALLEHCPGVVHLVHRSEESRVGKRCVSTCKSRGSPSTIKTT